MAMKEISLNCGKIFSNVAVECNVIQLDIIRVVLVGLRQSVLTMDEGTLGSFSSCLFCWDNTSCCD